MTAFQKTISILIFLSTAATWLLSFSTFGGPEGMEQAIVLAFFGLLVLAFTIAGTATFIAAIARKTLRFPSHLPLVLALVFAFGTIATPFVIGSINSSRSHTVQFTNLTEKTYTSVQVEHPGFTFTFGNSAPLAAASYGMSVAKIPDSARLTGEIEGEGPVEIEVDFTAAKAAWNKQGKIDTLHIVIAADGTALGLIETRGEAASYLDGSLYPFQGDPAYQQYRKLTEACRTGDNERAGQLILSGAPVEWDDPIGLSPLEWSCLNSSPDIVELILSDRLEEVSSSRIAHSYKLAAQTNSVAILNKLLKVSAPKELTTRQPHTDILYQACEAGNEPALELLLTKGGFDANMPFNDIGFSALHAAIQYNNPRAVEILLEHGADPRTSIGSETVTDRARRSGTPEIVRLLEEAAAANPRPE